MKTLAIYAFFITLVLGSGSIIGTMTGPDEWFVQLSKPSFNPPGWVFGPVWSFLYILIAIAGCRTWLRDRCSLSMKLWFAQMTLNYLWSPVFFEAHRIDAALALIVVLLATIIAYAWYTWPHDKQASMLFFPYIAWVFFATILNGALLWLNSPTVLL